MDYFTIETDARTGKTTRIDWSPERIAAYEAENAKASVPKSITPRQCRLLLLQQGLLSEVEKMITAQDEATRITWEYAIEFRRDDPLLNQLAVNLKLSPEQLDQFFIAANAL